MNYIDQIKDQLNEQMHLQCCAFMLIGTPRETPRYLNYGDFDHDTKVLTIESTQNSNIFFKVETDFDYVDCQEFWNQFKEYRTDFLLTNYPTINPS